MDLFYAGFDHQEGEPRRPGLVRVQGRGPLAEHQDEAGVHQDPGARRALRQVGVTECDRV